AVGGQMQGRFPAAEQDELAGYFRKYGADPETAARMAAAVSSDPGTALRVHTREELGVDPEGLPSPLLAGAASLLAFSLGALVPLLPYLAGLPVLAATLVITAVALAAGGMTVGWLTGRPRLRSGPRQLALGGMAIPGTVAVGGLIRGPGACLASGPPGGQAAAASRASTSARSPAAPTPDAASTRSAPLSPWSMIPVSRCPPEISRCRSLTADRSASSSAFFASAVSRIR